MPLKLVLSFLFIILASDVTGSSFKIKLKPSLMPERRATVSKDMMLTGDIQLGTPPQHFSVLFDTKSTYFWLYSQDCWFYWPCWLGRTFKHRESSTYQALSGSTSLNFFQGKVHGRIANDIFSVGKERRNVTFLDVTATTANFGDAVFYPFNGILGIGYPSNSTHYNILDALFKYFLVEPTLTGFSLFLKKNREGRIENGEIVFGDTDPVLFQSETLTMHDLSETGKWAISVNEVLLNGTVVDNGRTAVMDIMTLNIGVPNTVLDAIKKQLGMRENSTDTEFSCSLLTSNPEFSFVIGKNKYTLSLSDIAFKESNLFRPRMCCNLLMYGHNENFWILGNAFLSSFYSVWDVKGKQFGLARLQNQNDYV